MITITLDTSAYSAFKRGHPEVIERLRSTHKIFMPTIVLGELLGGFAVGKRVQRNRQELDQFLASPRVQIVQITEATADRYAFIYASLRKAGHPIPTNDLWIAASAMEYSAELLTTDRDFLYVEQILVSYVQV